MGFAVDAGRNLGDKDTMTDQELNEIEKLIQQASAYRGEYDCLSLADHLLFEDIPALIAEVRQLKAERDALAKRICVAQCWDRFRTNECMKPLEDCQLCWLEWARKEAGKVGKDS